MGCVCVYLRVLRGVGILADEAFGVLGVRTIRCRGSDEVRIRRAVCVSRCGVFTGCACCIVCGPSARTGSLSSVGCFGAYNVTRLTEHRRRYLERTKLRLREFVCVSRWDVSQEVRGVCVMGCVSR